jgi:UTP--glucose-1-phosphate uridylyltransferase
MVEKPPLEQAPSDLAIVGRYVLTPSVIGEIERAPTGKGGERYITEGLAAEIEARGGVFAKRFSGRRFDTGRPAGYLAASLAAALRREDLAVQVRERVTALLQEGGAK